MFVRTVFLLCFVFIPPFLQSQELPTINLDSKMASLEVYNAGDVLINDIHIAAMSSDGSILKIIPLHNNKLDAGERITFTLDLTEIQIQPNTKPYLSIYSQNNLIVQKEINFIETLPSVLHLSQNFPNPFNSSTSISFEIPQEMNNTLSQLSIYDVTGKIVKTLINNKLEAGEHRTHWDGTNNEGVSLSSGIYYYRLTNGSLQETKKLLLLK